MTPLHCAAFVGCLEVVALLLDRGARISAPDSVRRRPRAARITAGRRGG
jgi:ankyrin repeat protein